MITRKPIFLLPVISSFILASALNSQSKKIWISNKDSKMSELVRKASNSVVSIQTFISTEKENWCRVGSGFVYDKNGFVVTRKSVVQGGDSIIVTLVDGRSVPARLFYHDEDTEVVLLKLPVNNLTPLPIGKVSQLNIRSQLTLIGNSLGVFPSVTLGIYLGRRSDGMLKLGVVVPPGNCGGAVIDEKGRVIGILAGRVLDNRFSSNKVERMGVALPIEKARPALNYAMKHIDDRGWIGVSVVNLGSDNSGKGVKVVSVVPGSPAEHAQICKGDTIVAFGKRAVHSASELADWVRQISPGHKIMFKIHRGRKIISKYIRVGVAPWLHDRGTNK